MYLKVTIYFITKKKKKLKIIFVSGAYNRQAKLRDLGIQKLLQQLLSANDAVLFDK